VARSGPVQDVRMLSNDRLVTAVRSGDDAAFDEIVRRFQPQLTGYARSLMGGAHHDAEEAVQDSFVRALKALRADDREIALRSWLHAIVRNRCLDQLRKPGRTTDIEPHEAFLRDAGPGPVTQIGRRAELADVIGGLEALPERQRRALVMHELEDRSHSQIGRVLGVTAGASKALVCRARHGMTERVVRAA
jgi:RNA polymerase sigma-70 factor, ECF subfamily